MQGLGLSVAGLGIRVRQMREHFVQILPSCVLLKCIFGWSTFVAPHLLFGFPLLIMAKRRASTADSSSSYEPDDAGAGGSPTIDQVSCR